MTAFGGIVRERGGAELAERLEHLDRTWGRTRADAALPPPTALERADADVVLAGGGLSLLIAAELAQRGVSVVVLERSRAGVAHREWNASGPELEPLIEGGVMDRRALEELVVARYEKGFCRFHGGAPHWVSGVLDHAVAAGPLLRRVRAVAEARGVRFVDHARVDAFGAGADAVRVGWEDENGARSTITAKLLLDARGAGSPYATADLVCPTVGGVMKGLDDVDPHIGEILVTTEDASAAGQHIWEAFPGLPNETTVYLFTYAMRDAVAPGALTTLYERFFRTLPEYKRGAADLVRPTFGFIPGWSRIARPPSPPHPRVVLVGDVAARHSPLTFCGFGFMLRTFRPVAGVLASAIERNAAPISPLLRDEPVHAFTGLLARIMANGDLRGKQLNALLDAAFTSLEEEGNAAYASLLKDQMSARAFLSFLRRTARHHRAAYRAATSVSPLSTIRWAARLARGALV